MGVEERRGGRSANEVLLQVRERRGRPRIVRRGKRSYRVQKILDVWIYQSRWWSDEERRIYFRLWTNRGVMEIWRSEGEWRMGKMLD